MIKEKECAPFSPHNVYCECLTLTDTDGKELPPEALQLLAAPGEASQWVSLLARGGRARRGPLRVRSAAQPLAQTLDPMLLSYLEFLRLRGCHEQAEEITLFAETEVDHNVLWCHDKYGCFSLRFTCHGESEGSSVCVITIGLPLRYPEVSHAASVSVLGCHASPEFVRELTEGLEALTADFSAAGAHALMGTVGMARQMSSEIPILLTSPHFGFCESCSRVKRKSAEGGMPQCVELDPTTKTWVCCRCGGPSQLLPLVYHVDTHTHQPWVADSTRFSAAERSVEVDCCICYSDDASTMIRFNCGCWYCFPCFFRLCESSMETQAVMRAQLPTLTEVVNSPSTARWDWRHHAAFSPAARRSMRVAAMRSALLLDQWRQLLKGKGLRLCHCSVYRARSICRRLCSLSNRQGLIGPRARRIQRSLHKPTT
ncbi:hypothetical protein STCU_12148 [Strigomonas culicis]|uniref:RWD domain-containing protein n=1 Tax=Strigomonas culicis TaxID=28005 RepID=S9UXM7_9TRYP|nr:hypothetical protein STCU_12148 [Strigomonas culicis]|eukprot:EPY15295.1 hypothetical protein STCU_12148 [Strigomonas culicis]